MSDMLLEERLREFTSASTTASPKPASSAAPFLFPQQ
jgi:hypothetical protein